MGIRHKIGLLIVLLCFPIVLSAQMTYGVTGLLHMPSGEMQRDKTVMLGGNFLNNRKNLDKLNGKLNIVVKFGFSSTGAVNNA